jgi:hypothetical protein
MSMQGLDTDSDDRPVNPPKIISTKVIVNPFEDIAIRDATIVRIIFKLGIKINTSRKNWRWKTISFIKIVKRKKKKG